MRCGLIACSALATLALAPSTSAAPERGGREEVVKVVDFEFRPESLQVKRGETVDFRWIARNGSPHQVALRTGPSGVDKADFSSARGEHIDFEPRFLKAGLYKFICRIHPISMKLDVSVKGGAA